MRVFASGSLTIGRTGAVVAMAASVSLITSCGGGGGDSPAIANPTVASASVGVQVNLPASLQATTSENLISLRASDVSTFGADVDGDPAIFISFYPSPVSIQDTFDGSGLGPNFGSPVETFMVAGRSASLFRPTDTMSADTVVVVTTAGGFLVFHDRGARFDTSGEFLQIVNTAVFLNGAAK